MEVRNMATAASSDSQSMRLLGDSERRQDGNLFDECTEDEQEDVTKNGINFWQTAISISGGSAGYGFLVVALNVVSTGWAGLAVYCVLFAAIVFTSVMLGRCWNAVRHVWQEDRHPYGAIGYEAFGPWTRDFVNILVAAVSFTSALGSLLAFSETTLIIGGAALHGTFCVWPLVYGAVLCPLLWLGTPKDFWWVMVTSFVTVLVATILITIDIGVSGVTEITDSGLLTGTPAPDAGGPRESNTLHLVEIAGTLIWLMGLHGSFPTVQQDMQQPQSFGRAVVLAAVFTFLLAAPVFLASVIVYGSTLTDVTGDASVLTLLPDGALKSISAVLMLGHLGGCVLLLNNPLFQYLEEVLHIPSDFSWKRVVLRTSVLLAQVFIQETIPHFSLVTAITGGLMTPVLVFIMPCVCYLRLRNETWRNSVLETAVCLLIIGLTPVAMVVILFVTGSNMIHGGTVFTAPCYVNATAARI